MPVTKESMLPPGMMDAPADVNTQLCFNPPNGPFDGESKASMVMGTLDSKHDEDWIIIELSEGKEYTISVGRTDGADPMTESGYLSDSVLELLDSKGNSTGYMNDDADAAKGALGSQITFTPEAGSGKQKYYVSVSAYTGNPGADNHGKYTVTVSEKVVLTVGEGKEIGDGDAATAQKLVGTDFADKITGGAGADTLDGMAGDDELNGGGGDDLLVGGKGADKLSGGAHGDVGDTASYSYSSEAVTINLLSGQADGGDATGDKLDDTIENVIGSMHDDTLTGNDEDNMLWGLAGMDTLDGEYGDDIIEGGYGADTLIGGDGSDTASYATSMMGVTVRLHSQQAMHGDAEGDEFGKRVKATYFNNDGDPVEEMVPDIENLTGSAHDDILAGDSRDNTIMGGAGDDRLYGGPGGGDDMLHGQGGNDHIFGGKGDDTLDGGDGNDHLWGNGGADIYRGGKGDDMIYANKEDMLGKIDGGAGKDTVSYAKLEDTPYTINIGTMIMVENVIGSQDDDTITGDGMNNTVEGGEGGDTMQGGGGMGKDTLSYAGSDAGVRVTLRDTADGDSNWVDASRGHASGDKVTAASDGDQDTQTFYHLMGSMYDDDLVGDSRDNSLMGGDGDDELTGMGGADTVEGGAGADVMDGGDESNTDDMGDWLSYASSDAGVTINLARQLATGGHASGDEIVTAEEDHDMDDETDEIDVSTFEHVRGSAHDDDLTGDHRMNTLEGGAGADDLDGGAGMDTATFASAMMGVTVDLGANKGMKGDAEGDTYSNIEMFVGSRMADTFVAGRGHDSVDGSGGSDTISYEKSRAGVTVNLSTQMTPATDATTDLVGAWRYLANNLDKFYVDGSKEDADAGRTNTPDTRDAHEDGFASLEALLTALGGDNPTDVKVDDGGKMDDQGTPETSDDIPVDDFTVDSVLTDDYDATPAAITSLYGNDNDRTDLRNNYNKGDQLDGIENVIGSDFDDTITGNSMADNDGTADVDEAKTSANKLEGGAGKDTITGGAGNDVIDGGDGDDPMLNGGAGHDDIMGGAGRDKLNGGDGDDTLNGGAGDDDLTGGAGDDIFVFTPDGSGTDTIVDFTRGSDNNDRINLEAFGLSDSDLVKLITLRGSNVIIDLSSKGGGQIILSGVGDLDDLDMADPDSDPVDKDGTIEILSEFIDANSNNVLTDEGDFDGIFIL